MRRGLAGRARPAMKSPGYGGVHSEQIAQREGLARRVQSLFQKSADNQHVVKTPHGKARSGALVPIPGRFEAQSGVSSLPCGLQQPF